MLFRKKPDRDSLFPVEYSYEHVFLNFFAAKVRNGMLEACLATSENFQIAPSATFRQDLLTNIPMISRLEMAMMIRCSGSLLGRVPKTFEINLLLGSTVPSRSLRDLQEQE